MLNTPKAKEIEQKMKEEKEADNNNINNQIKALLKCDICKTNFDLNIHLPMVAKCGHTYCKKCIYNGGNKDFYGVCPLDNIRHVLGIESCIPNLKLELIIKTIFNYSEPKITEKKIICFNNEIKLNNNSIFKYDENKLFRSNSGNKNCFCNHDEFFPNILTDKKNKTITNFKINKDKKILNLKLYNNDNVDVIEELNVMNDDKINFTEENKINDESIDTIPINDEKSNANISFKDEFNELLNKNIDITKKNNSKNNDNLHNKDNEFKTNNDNDNDNYNNKNKGNLNDNYKIEEDNNEIIKENVTNKEINNNENYNNEEKNDKEDNINNHINKSININKKNLTEIRNNNKIKCLSQIQRNSINFMKKNNNIEIDAIDEIDEYFIRPRTITVSKNIKEQKKPEKNSVIKNKNNKNEKQNIKKENNYDIKKFPVYDKISLKKRKTISQDNNGRNSKFKIKLDIKNKSEEKVREKHNNIKEINIFYYDKENEKNKEKEKENYKKNVNNDKDEEENENNDSDIYIEEENKPKLSEQQYRILSKRIGLKKHPDNEFNNRNSNRNSQINNFKNSSEERVTFGKPIIKNSSLNSYCRANKLLSKNSNKENNKNNCNYNYISNDISSFQKKKYINNKLKNMDDYSSNSYHKTKSTYNKKKLKGKSNLFLTVKNNYNISLNNSNNNINSNNTINNNANHLLQLMTQTQNNINKFYFNKKINNKIKNNKISLSMSPDTNKDILDNNYKLSPICSDLTENKKNKNNFYKNNVHSTRDVTNNKIANYSKDISGIIKTITIKRVNSLAAKNLGKSNNIYKIEEENNLKNDKRNHNLEEINEIKNKLRFDFNRVFNYQINLYENLKNTKNKQILLARNKKYKSILEEFINHKNNYEQLKNIKICFLPDGELFIGQQELNLPKYGITYNLSGDYYKGSFVEGKKDGNGILIYKNGTKYEGDFKNNKHEGFGKLKQLDGETFIGEWKDGKINGNGVRCHCNGDRYIGSYVNNIRNGHGIYTFSNGDSYEGNWLDGKATGKGIFKFKNGDIYEGEFKYNIIMGHGSFKTKNGDIYSGIFKNGLINGKGVLTYQNGEKYVGFFKNGKKNGIGKMYDKNGNEYKSGLWKNDKYLGNKYI